MFLLCCPFQRGPTIAKKIKYQSALVPEDSYCESMKHLFERLQGVDQTLRDPKITTVRLITNPENMVVREPQRAFMYFNMYGMTTDQVVLKRIFPKSDGYPQEWAALQPERAADIQTYFEPVPVVNDHYTLNLQLLCSKKDQIKLSRQGEDFTIGIGTFKRNILLPRKISPLPTQSAAMDSDQLVVHFGGAGAAV